MKEKGCGLKGWMARLMKVSAVMLGISLTARLAAGYLVRGFQRLARKRNFSMDVIAPKYGPALVVSTEDFDDDFAQILYDGYHTRLFLRLTRLEILRKVCVWASLAGVVITFFLWLISPED